jgi:hypothetical protein
MSVPEEVRDQLDEFKQLQYRLVSSAKASTSLRAQEREAAGASALTGTQRAQFFLVQAQAVQSLYHLILRASGKDPHSLPNVTAEMERLKQYTKKVNRMVAAEELAAAKPSASLDVAAANRFIGTLTVVNHGTFGTAFQVDPWVSPLLLSVPTHIFQGRFGTPYPHT